MWWTFLGNRDTDCSVVVDQASFNAEELRLNRDVKTSDEIEFVFNLF